MPIAYMTVVEGWAHTRCGPGGMLNTEAAISIAAVIAFVAVAAATAKRRAFGDVTCCCHSDTPINGVKEKDFRLAHF